MAKVCGQPKNLKQLGPIEITKNGIARFRRRKSKKIKKVKKGGE